MAHMGGGGGISNVDSTGEGVHCLKSEAVNNGFENRFENDNGQGGLATREGIRTYKRRKRTGSSSENKGQEDGRGFLEADGKLTDESTKEPPDCPPKDKVSSDGSNDCSHKQCRNFVLERIYQSLNDEKDGIQRCIQNALRMTIKESDPCEKDRHIWSLQAGLIPNGTLCTNKGQVDVTSNESLDESHRPVTEKCKHAFLNILLSEKFTLMCKLLCENFQEKKAENLLSLNLINMRMKDGVYEHAPLLFCVDIQQVWKKLQGIGFELMSLGKSLSDVSLTCFNEQFPTNKSEFCTCRRCGSKADGRDCLVCDSCEDMYHVSCIEPAVKEIPPKSWYCASCTTILMKSPHENCVVCERLNAPRNLNSQAGIEKKSTTENMSSESEETSDCTRDDFRQPTVRTKKRSCVCKLCGSEVENGEKVKICAHLHCPYKYYHIKCLPINQLKSCGSIWYCPSCLCRACFLDKDDNQIVLCDGCDNAYHIYCLIPPLASIPKGKWFCRRCDVKRKEIRRVRRAYEKREKIMKRNVEVGKIACENLEKKMDEKCEQEADKGREGMHMLVTAALNDAFRREEE